MLTILAGLWAMILTNNRRLDDIIKRLERFSLKLNHYQHCRYCQQTRSENAHLQPRYPRP
jgi:hypothetical protein